MGMTIKSLKTVCPSRWFSFYEALEDILDYWRAILSFLRSDEAKGTKCEKIRSLVSSPEAVHDLLVKMRFLKTNACAVISIIKELEAESTHDTPSLSHTGGSFARTHQSMAGSNRGLRIRCHKYVGPP